MRSVVVLLAAAGTAEVPGPRTATQIAVFEKAARKAAVLSEAATSEAIALIESVKAWIPSCSNLSGAELLELYEKEMRTVELVHNLEADALLSFDEGYLPNLWEQTLGNCSDGLLDVTDLAETNIYGFPSFESPCCPQSFREAMDRPIYAALNSLRIDAGNPWFGNVSLVLRHRPEAVLIAPADTGSVEFTCNKSLNMSISFGIENCSLWEQVPIGTTKDHKHLIGAAVTFYDPEWLVRQFERFVPRCAATTVIVRKDLGQYWEAVYAKPMYWSDVKFIVASFDDLFGTRDGAALVDFAQRHSKAIVWARSESETPGVLLNQRLLDPDTSLVTNATMDRGAGDLKAAAWSRAIHLRADHRVVVSRLEWRRLYDEMRAGLPWVADLKTLVTGVCADTSACFGFTAQNQTCVCYIVSHY